MNTENIQSDHNAEEIDAVDLEPLPTGEANQKTDSTTASPSTSKAVTERKTDIALTPEGVLSPTTHTEMWRIATTLLASRALPKQFENGEQVFMAMQFLREHGISYATGLRQTTIINGSLSIWGELPLGLCRASGKLDWINEKIYTKEYEEICFANKNLEATPFYAVCRLLRGSDPEPVERVFSIEDAKTAGLLSKPGPWKLYPKRMLQMRARSWALKDNFPDVLSGIAIAEYDHDMLLDDRGAVKIGAGANSASDIANELNETYLDDKAKTHPEPEPSSMG